MRKPLRNKHPAKQPIATPKSLSSPIGGWNAREALANMPPQDAVFMRNWVPRTGFCETRKGAADWSTGITGTVQSIMPYNDATGGHSLFAASNSGIYDVTSNGAVGAAVHASSLGRWQYTQLSTSGGYFLSCVNGQDNLALYDGTLWYTVTDVSTPYAITGLATTELINVCIFKRRQWFVQKLSLSLWYLDVDSIAGDLNEFPLGALFGRGGYIVDIESWTLDGGDGIDDYLVIFTSEGQLAVYKGTDPSSATTFALVGLFYIGKALGYRSLIKYGGDVLVLTTTGAYPLSKALISRVINTKTAITDKIVDAFRNATLLYGSNFGWDALVYPEETLLIVNIPTVALATAEQYVMNTATGAWCSFTGWNATCWALSNSEIYFGAIGKVCKAYTGYDDFGQLIQPDAATAYNYFGNTGQNKHWTLVRPTFRTTDSYTSSVSLEIDFRENFLAEGPSIAPNSLSLWDIALWDEGIWGGASEITKEWLVPSAQPGYCASTRIKVASLSSQVQWISTDYVYELGGIL